MNKVSKFIIQFRTLVILIIAAITVFMGIKMMDLKINSDIINLRRMILLPYFTRRLEKSIREVPWVW